MSFWKNPCDFWLASVWLLNTLVDQKNGSSRQKERTDQYHALCNARYCAFCLVLCAIFLGTRYLVVAAAGQRQREKKVNITQQKMQQNSSRQLNQARLANTLLGKYTFRPAHRVRSLGVMFLALALIFWYSSTVGARCGDASHGGKHQDGPALEQRIWAWHSRNTLY